MAIRAVHDPLKIQQPDGSILTLFLHGDEYSHFTTTEDGYAVMQDSTGTYMYAVKSSNGSLIPGNVEAHDIASRSNEEEAHLATLTKNLQTTPSSSSRRMNRVAAAGKDPQKAFPLSGNPRSLVILVNFSDVAFTVHNPQIAFTNLLNQSGYSTNGGTGSARDWFSAGSYGKFSPVFDVAGPYTLPHTMSYYGANNPSGEDSNPQQMAIDACRMAANAGINFAQYDTDNDGFVDNVFIYYAGYNEAEGAGTSTIWPHRWTLANYSTVFNGKIVFDYACTSELKGTPSNSGGMCGIGTFCHEFSHTLGLPDFYNTTGADVYTLDEYSVMDYGPYLNNGRTPPTYSCLEKFYLGFLTPTALTQASNDTLPDAKSIAKAYLLSQTTHNLSAKHPFPAEYYLLENRQKTGWDKYLPGHGMLIWHIDYSASDWSDNVVNNQYPLGVDMMEADETANTNTQTADPFPGTNKITSYTPRLWATGDSNIPTGINMNCPITGISENNNVISFRFKGGAEAKNEVVVGNGFVLTIQQGHIIRIDSQKSNNLYIYNQLGQLIALHNLETGTFSITLPKQEFIIVRIGTFCRKLVTH
jgi:M6 family metalloprotease-like protein